MNHWISLAKQDENITDLAEIISKLFLKHLKHKTTSVNQNGPQPQLHSKVSLFSTGQWLGANYFMFQTLVPYFRPDL